MFSFDDDKTRWFMRHILPHEPALRAWLRRTKSGIEIDDVIQETYTVLAARESVSDIRFPRAYLFQIAHSVVVRHIRRSRIVSIQAIDDLNLTEPADEAATPEKTAIDRDELRRLAEALAAMSDRTREAFILRRVHGLSQREIATRMWLSESTVEKHIANGVRFLIKWFGDGGKADDQTSKEQDRDTSAPNDQDRNRSRH